MSDDDRLREYERLLAWAAEHYRGDAELYSRSSARNAVQGINTFREISPTAGGPTAGGGPYRTMAKVKAYKKSCFPSCPVCIRPVPPHRWRLVDLGNEGELIWAGDSTLMSYVVMADWIFCKIFKRPFTIQNVENAFYQLDRREER